MITQEQGLTGYSLSLCIANILQGAVKEAEVDKIVASTNAPTRADFLNLLDGYAQNYWADNPEEGKAIALRFYDAGKIDQPRTRGEAFTNIAHGMWRKAETPEVKTTVENYPGTTIEGLIGTSEVVNVRTERTAAAMRSLKEGAPYTFKVAKPLKITPRV